MQTIFKDNLFSYLILEKSKETQRKVKNRLAGVEIELLTTQLPMWQRMHATLLNRPFLQPPKKTNTQLLSFSNLMFGKMN